MQTTSQSCLAGVEAQNSTGMISSYCTTVTNKHRTPPRVNGHTLPSTPSSCERLRRVAPSPILVVPRSKLRYSPPSPSRTNRTPPRRPPRPSVAQALSFNLRQQERASSVCDDDDDDVNSIVQSYMRFSNSHTEGNQSDGEDDIEVPTILDNGTRASELAIERNIDRSVVSQAVPEEMQDAEFLTVTPTARSEDDTMTPEEFYRAHYKPQVMVRFNTNVFGAPAPGEANDEDEKDNGPLEPDSPESRYDDDEISDRKASTSSSWYVPERRWTDESEYANNDNVRETVIDEEAEDDDSTPGVTSTADPLAASHLPDALPQAEAPSLDETEKTSPESFNTELITPAHHDVPLPLPPRGISEQGVPRLHEVSDGVHVNRRFLPAKSSFRPSTAPVERSPNVLGPAAITILKRPKLIAPTPRNHTSDGLQLDTTGRRSIDVDHERAIEHAGGTPGRRSRDLEDRTTPPVPSLPKHLLKLPPPAMDMEDEEAETSKQVVEDGKAEPSTKVVESGEAGPSAPGSEERKKLDISRLLDELEDPDMDPVADSEAEDEDELPEELEPKPLPEDLAKVDRSTKLELIVNQDSGLPVWCTLPIRRVSRPEYWQKKEDQALAKAIRWHDPPPKPQPFQQTGAVHFGQPPKKRTKWTFFHSNKSTPTLKGVMINDGTGKDHTRGKIKLNIEVEGVYSACGYDEAGQVEWMFEYLVTKREKAKSRRQRRVRDVYPMTFFAIPAFLDPSRGQVLFPFSKTFQPVYESEKMPVARVGRPPAHDSPPKWNLEEVKMARRAGATPPAQGPPTSAVGRMFGAIGIKRSRPNTPASTDKLPKPLTSSRPGTASPASRQVDSSGNTPVRSGGLLVGLKHKLSKRPDTSTGIVSIAHPSHSAPLALRSRDDLQLSRFDTIASGKSGSGKSIKGMFSKLGLRPSSRSGSARDGHFPRYDRETSLEPVQPVGPLGRRRSKSAASALFPARISPSPLGLVHEESNSGQSNESKAESTKTIMGRIRTFSVGARPNSRAKSPLAVESTITPDATVVESTNDGTETIKPKSFVSRIRSLSSASRPGSSRATPANQPEFDLEELLSAREAAGSALGEHDPVTSLIKHTTAPSGSTKPPIPRTQSSTSQISPTPPFVLEKLLKSQTFGSSDSLAASITSSPMIGPAKWKGKGKEVIPEPKAARPSSSKELPVWFSTIPNVGSSKSINSLSGGEGPSSSSSSALRPITPRVQSIINQNQVTIVQDQVEKRRSIALNRSSLSIQDIAEYVDGRFSRSRSAITLDDFSSSGHGSDRQDEEPQEQMTFEDAVEMSNRRKGLVPPTALPQKTKPSIEDAEPAAQSDPLARKNTFDRLLKAGETLTMRAINTSVQRIVTENQLVPIEEISGPATDSDHEAPGTRSRKMKARARDGPYTPPVSIKAPPMESPVLFRPDWTLPNIQSLSPIDPNIRKWNPSTTPKSPVSKSPRARAPTTPHAARNKENESASKPAPVTPAPPTPTTSLWQRLTRPRSLSTFKLARTTPSPPAEIAPPLPPLAKSVQKLATPSPQFPQDIGPDPFQSLESLSRIPATPSGGLARSLLPRSTASSSSVSSMAQSGSRIDISSMQNSTPRPLSSKAAGERPATASDGPDRAALPRSTVSSSSVSSMTESATTTGIVLMQNTVPQHMRNCHPFAVAIRPIEGRIEGSEWTNLNPQPTHYLVEDPVFKRAMEEHREEARNTISSLIQKPAGSIPTSASSSRLAKPPLKPILRKRPSTTQTEQIPQEMIDSHLPNHLRPNRWNSKERSPVPSPLASGPMPPKRDRPSTAQVQR